MTRDEVIEAFAKGLVVKVKDGSMGKIVQLDQSDLPALVEGVGWQALADIEVVSEEEAQRIEAERAEKAAADEALTQKIKAATTALLQGAPRVKLTDEGREAIRPDRRDADFRVLGVFPNGHILTVSLAADGSLMGTGDGPPDHFTLIED